MMQQHIVDSVTEVDSCLTSCDGICGIYYYHTEFPEIIMEMNLDIACKEMLNIVLALKLFAKRWKDTTV